MASYGAIMEYLLKVIGYDGGMNSDWLVYLNIYKLILMSS